MTTYICTLYYSPRFLSHCCLRSQNPDYHSGGHPRPLPQRTTAIRAHQKAQTTISCHSGNSYPLRLQKRKGVYGGGKREGGGLQMYSLWPISWCPVFFSSAHVTMCTYTPVEILATHIHIYIYTYTHTHIHIHIHVYSLVHVHMHTYIHTYTYMYIYIYANIHPHAHSQHALISHKPSHTVTHSSHTHSVTQ